MLRKDRCVGSVSPLRTSGGPSASPAEPGSSTLILYCAERGGTLTFAGESSTIASGEAVLIQDPGSARCTWTAGPGLLYGGPGPFPPLTSNFIDIHDKS